MFKRLFRMLKRKSDIVSPLKITPIFDGYKKESEMNFNKLTQAGSQVDIKKLEATQRFNEFLWRLDQRYQQLKYIENFTLVQHPENMAVPMKDIQMEFINCVESYYQQLYACLSAFVMFLNHVSPHSFRRNLPISKIKQFLDYLQKMELNITDEVGTLQSACVFRSKFIDHVQQHTLHNWMTFAFQKGNGPECSIIYFFGESPEIDIQSFFQINQTGFQSQIDAAGCYISPSHTQSHHAIFRVCTEVIKHISK